MLIIVFISEKISERERERERRRRKQDGGKNNRRTKPCE
jgi:hypothetical protein